MTVLNSKPKINKKYDRTLSRGPNGFNQQKLLARLSLGLERDTSLIQINCTVILSLFTSFSIVTEKPLKTCVLYYSISNKRAIKKNCNTVRYNYVNNKDFNYLFIP